MSSRVDGIQIDLAKLSPNLRALLRAQLREFIDLVDDHERALGLNRLMRLVANARREVRISRPHAA
jgi:hypothetical protein